MANPKPESFAFVTLTDLDRAIGVLEEASFALTYPPHRASLQTVIDALYALSNDTDAVVLREDW